jgi:serine/threonine protein kinase
MEFAMKVVRVGEGSKEKAKKEIQALKQEISLLKQLTHPNIVAYRTFQVAVAFDEVEIIMELVSGGTLK